MTDGLLVVDKGSGISSHDVVARARRASGIRKIGHAGTLDPMATGVVVLGLGRATRLIRFVQDQEKEYQATIQFGIATDTLDATGVETERHPMAFGRSDLLDVLESFRGDIEQVPPMVSALKHQGQRLYEIARAGGEVERPARQVTIYRIELVDFTDGDFPVGDVRVVCSKGTYIRSLADDIARALGGTAHLSMLRRLRVGNFRVEAALPVEELTEWQSHLLEPKAAVAGLAEWKVSSDEAASVRHGRPIPAPDGDGRWAIFDPDGQLLAVYVLRGTRAVAEVVLS